MNRRNFQTSLLALLAAGSSSVTASPQTLSRLGPGLEGAHRLFFYLPDASAVLALGRRCVDAGVRPAAGFGLDDGAAEAIRADFAAGRVVRIDGWLISESEARIAAALAGGS